MDNLLHLHRDAEAVKRLNNLVRAFLVFCGVVCLVIKRRRRKKPKRRLFIVIPGQLYLFMDRAFMRRAIQRSRVQGFGLLRHRHALPQFHRGSDMHRLSSGRIRFLGRFIFPGKRFRGRFIPEFLYMLWLYPPGRRRAWRFHRDRGLRCSRCRRNKIRLCRRHRFRLHSRLCLRYKFACLLEYGVHIAISRNKALIHTRGGNIGFPAGHGCKAVLVYRRLLHRIGNIVGLFLIRLRLRRKS